MVMSFQLPKGISTNSSLKLICLANERRIAFFNNFNSCELQYNLGREAISELGEEILIFLDSCISGDFRWWVGKKAAEGALPSKSSSVSSSVSLPISVF